jgi:YCII-related domain
MAKFVYIYAGGKMPESPEEGQQVMAAWMDWMGGLGDSILDQGNPFGASTSVSPSGVGGAGSLGGYSIINADSLDDATKKADGCPILSAGGHVEVYEAVAM